MKSTLVSSLVLAATVLAGAQAMAADLAGGDVPNPVTGMTMRQLYPERYDANFVVSTKTREQVQTELTQAQQSHSVGDTKDTITNLSWSQLFPAKYDARYLASEQTRAEVRAEAVKVQRSLDAADTRGAYATMTWRQMFPGHIPQKSVGM